MKRRRKTIERESGSRGYADNGDQREEGGYGDNRERERERKPRLYI